MEKHEVNAIAKNGMELKVSVAHFVKNAHDYEKLTNEDDLKKVEAYRKEHPNVAPQVEMEEKVADTKLAKQHDKAVKEKKAPAPKAADKK